MEAGDIIDQGPMGIVVETGHDAKKSMIGDRVVLPFVIACGSRCFFQRTL
jgi:threonine dehydrogenase-like Zn-dependent dehydrogenase